jgi:DNA polymerase-3 subunit gamma/tau
LQTDAKSAEHKVVFGIREISFEEIQEAWHHLIEHKRQMAEWSEVTILDRNFEWKSPYIRLKLDNPIQQEQAQKHKADWILYLQQYLQNSFSIQIETEILKEEERKLVPYTNSEKWNFLAQKYALLEDLRNRLGLEID